MDTVFAAAASCGLMIAVLAVFAVALLGPSRRNAVEVERLRPRVADFRRERPGRVGT